MRHQAWQIRRLKAWALALSTRGDFDNPNTREEVLEARREEFKTQFDRNLALLDQAISEIISELNELSEWAYTDKKSVEE